ncbi:hypothetical protein ABIS04_13370 [Shewanella sp. H8]|uniref:hypothetical protein n=1 Tax=Shewanella sp. H8 TaxID=3342676 RepID=UPI00331556D7
MSNTFLHNDYLRSLLIKHLNELKQLEDNKELILSFSIGICNLVNENGSVVQLLKSIYMHQIKREHDPFCDHRGGMLDYYQETIFFRISHKTRIDIGLYSEIEDMRILRNDYQWFSLQAIINFDS